MTDHLTFSWPCYVVALIVCAIALIVQTILYAAYFITLIVIVVSFLIWANNGFQL